MKGTTVTLFIFMFRFGYGLALTCYTCTDCPPDFLTIFTDQGECSAALFFDQPRCRKVVDQFGKVTRGCSTSIQCTANELLSKCGPDRDTGCTTCCETDKCNSATTFTYSVPIGVLTLLTVVYNYL